MTDRDHRITITPHPGRVRVRVAGAVVADTRDALRLEETGYPPVHYIPRADVLEAFLAASSTASRCPYKGVAHYHHVVVGDVRRPDAAWSYAEPLPGVAAIRGHLAFYPDRVDAIEAE